MNVFLLLPEFLIIFCALASLPCQRILRSRDFPHLKGWYVFNGASGVCTSKDSSWCHWSTSSPLGFCKWEFQPEFISSESMLTGRLFFKKKKKVHCCLVYLKENARTVSPSMEIVWRFFSLVAVLPKFGFCPLVPNRDSEFWVT